MIHHRHHHQKMIKLDQWLDLYAPTLDAWALLFIMLIALRRRDLISLIVLLEFTLVFFGQNWLKSLSLWGSLGLDYHYTLGIKDTLMALLLLCLAAHPVLFASYIVPALLCWHLWGSYQVRPYDSFLDVYHAWSPYYATTMMFQVIGLAIGDRGVGERFRKRIVPIDWNRLLQFGSSRAHSWADRVAHKIGKIKGLV